METRERLCQFYRLWTSVWQARIRYDTICTYSTRVQKPSASHRAQIYNGPFTENSLSAKQKNNSTPTWLRFTINHTANSKSRFAQLFLSLTNNERLLNDYRFKGGFMRVNRALRLTLSTVDLLVCTCCAHKTERQKKSPLRQSERTCINVRNVLVILVHNVLYYEI